MNIPVILGIINCDSEDAIVENLIGPKALKEIPSIKIIPTFKRAKRKKTSFKEPVYKTNIPMKLMI